jgi:hypothetical protein
MKKKILKKIKLNVGYDEFFKTSMKVYFEPFATVITNYEIIKLPKKVDLLIIEAEKPIEEYLEVMKYFKRFNILEFKSENDKFDLNKDFFKMGIYLNGVLFSEPDTNIENTTFTLVSSRRLSKLLKIYKAEKIKAGLYVINNISIIPIHVVIISEIPPDLVKEITALKELTVSKEIPKYLSELLEKYKENPEEYQKYLDLASSNYFSELNKAIEEKGEIKMNQLEKNTWAAIQYFKIDEKLYADGKNEGIIVGMEKGMEEGRQKGIMEGKEKGMMEGKEKGMMEGIEKGLLEGKLESAKRALLNGLDINTVMLITALDEKVIKKLVKELKKELTKP